MDRPFALRMSVMRVQQAWDFRLLSSSQAASEAGLHCCIPSMSVMVMPPGAGFCQLAGIAAVPGSEQPHHAADLQPSRNPALVLLLAHVSRAMQQQAVEAAMESLAQAFPGQGGGAGKDQPPAFVAGKVAR